jgi:hypothetical protein
MDTMSQKHKQHPEPYSNGPIVGWNEDGTAITNPEQAPFCKYEKENRPATDDAYAIGRTAIKVDQRVPVFAIETPVPVGTVNELEQALYCAGLSIPDLNILIRGSEFRAVGHYRGEEVTAKTNSSSVAVLLRLLQQACGEIDVRIGGIRVTQIDYDEQLNDGFEAILMVLRLEPTPSTSTEGGSG